MLISPDSAFYAFRAERRRLEQRCARLARTIAGHPASRSAVLSCVRGVASLAARQLAAPTATLHRVGAALDGRDRVGDVAPGAPPGAPPTRAQF